jgi:hypothetical protein
MLQLSAELKREPNKNPVGRMKIKATCSCKITVDFQPISWYYFPEDEVIAADFVLGL